MEFKGTKEYWNLTEIHNNSFGKQVEVTNNKIAIGVIYDPETEEGLANAKLIAAAPELLEALVGLKKEYEQLVDCGDCGNWNPRRDNCIVNAKKAINKALKY